MAKSKSVFVCQACGAIAPRWQGKCPECEAWNSIVEEIAADEGRHGRGALDPDGAEPTPITAEPTPITEAVTRVTRAEAYVEEIENREQLRDLADLVDCVRVQRGISREQMAQDVGSPVELLGEVMRRGLATLARAAKMVTRLRLMPGQIASAWTQPMMSA